MTELDQSTTRSTVPAADCCGPVEIDPRIRRHFDKSVRRRLASGDRFEPTSVSARLLELLGSPAGASVLEIGSGPGSMAMALLSTGAERYTGVDLSPEAAALAERRAREAGFGEGVVFHHGDGAAVRHERHDWVVLDRALCCYPDLERLIANTVSAAAKRYAFSVPDSRGLRGVLNRVWVSLENATNALRGRPCPGFVHDLDRIDRILVGAGLHRRREARTGLWYLALYERPSWVSRSVVPRASSLDPAV